MIFLALALALAPAPVPLPAPTLKGLQPMPQKGCSDIAWQRTFGYLAPDYRSGSNVVLLTDYGPGWMVFLTGRRKLGDPKMSSLSRKLCETCLVIRYELQPTSTLFM